LYLQHGSSDYIGEHITQLEHALQAAHFATQNHTDDPVFILAALLHDVGHLLMLSGAVNEIGQNKAKTTATATATATGTDADTGRSNKAGWTALGYHAHSELGAEWLRAFKREGTEPREQRLERIAQHIEQHAQAKRYLVSTDASYQQNLSRASQETLKAQGGMMTAAEKEDFEAHKDYLSWLDLRRADDSAKHTPHHELHAHNWSHYVPWLQTYLDAS